MSLAKKCARGACDLALIWIGLRLAFLSIILPFYLVPQERCRRSWVDIAEYPVLADICRDSYVAARLMMWDMADYVAREKAGETVP